MNTQTLNELCELFSKVHITQENRNTAGDIVMGESHKECGICYEEKPRNQVLSLFCCNQDICFDCLRRLNETNEPSCPFCRRAMGTFLRENGFVDRDEDIEMETPVTHHRNPYRTRNRTRETEDEDLQYAIALSLQEQEYTSPPHRRNTPRRTTDNNDPRKSTCGYCNAKIIDVRRHQQRNQRCIELQHRYHHR